MGMAGLLEVLALSEADARRAEEGGADRVVVYGSLTGAGTAPEPALVEKIRHNTGLPIRVLLRLRDDYTTTGGEVARLIGLISNYLDAGADGMQLGYINRLDAVDTDVVEALTGELDFPITFDCLDQLLFPEKGWDEILSMTQVDQILTAGSPRGMEEGLDDLLRTLRDRPGLAGFVLAGNGLLPEHVPWLARVGVSAFTVSEQVRLGGSFKAYVDAPLARTWRALIDDSVARAK